MIPKENFKEIEVFGLNASKDIVQPCDGDIICQDTESIPKLCEILINEVSTELTSFRLNLETYKCKSEELDNRNELLALQFEELRSKTNHGLLLDEAIISNNEEISILQQQVNLLKSENVHLRQLQSNTHKTISCLEQELNDYRNQQVDKNSIDGIKLLENKIEFQQKQLDRQNEDIRKLTEENINKNAEIQKLQDLLKERTCELESKSQEEEKIKNMEEELNKYMALNEHTENTLKDLSAFIDEQIAKKSDALFRMEEALNVAQEAIMEREKALARELLQREECNTLANTIGSVLNDAAQKVDRDFEMLQKQFDEKEKALLDKIDNLSLINEQQKEHINMLEKRYEKLKQKTQSVQAESTRYQTECKLTKTAYNELEEKLQSTLLQLQTHQMVSKTAEELEQHIKNLMQSNLSIKTKCKAIIEKTSLKYHNELCKLRDENYKLKAQVQYFRKGSIETN